MTLSGDFFISTYFRLLFAIDSALTLENVRTDIPWYGCDIKMFASIDYEAPEFQFWNIAFISRFWCRSPFHLEYSRSHYLCNIQAFNLCLNRDEKILIKRKEQSEKRKSFCCWKYFKTTYCGEMCPQPATKYIFHSYTDFEHNYCLLKRTKIFFPLKPSATDWNSSRY